VVAQIVLVVICGSIAARPALLPRALTASNNLLKSWCTT